MPRVTHVKKARKDNDRYGIKKGDSYYWWKFPYGSKICSLNPPCRSQLTQSAFLGGLYDLQDDIEAITPDNFKAYEGDYSEISDRIRELGEQCQESLDNMPESLQESPTGELLQERIDAMDEWAEEVDCVNTPEENPDHMEQADGESEEDFIERRDEVEPEWEDALAELQRLEPSI